MEEIVEELTPEDVAVQMLRCKLDVYTKMDDIHERLEVGANRMHGIEQTLSLHSKQRDDHANELKATLTALRGDLASSRNDFNNHDKNEMEKYDKIIEALDKLTARLEKTATDTENNTEDIKFHKEQEMIARIKNEAIEEHDAPYKEYRKKAILTVITIITGALTYGTWELVMFIADLSNKING